MRLFNSYRGLPKTVYVLFFVQVINRFGDFVVPFLTLLLTVKLGFSFGLTGIIVTISSLITIPASLIGGRFADEVGRKKTYLVGQGIAACLIMLCGFIKIPLIIVVLLIGSSFFNGFVRPSISAVMADVLPKEKRQAGSSLLYLGINIGVGLGPVVAGFLFNHFLPLLFIGDALTSFIAIGIFYKFIKETRPSIGRSIDCISEENEEKGSLLGVLIKKPQILVFLGIQIIYSLVYVQHKFSLPMMMNQVFHEKGPERFGFLMSINALTVIFLSLIIVATMKRFRPLTNIIIAGIFFTVGFGMIGVINSFSLYILSTIFWTIGEILLVTNFGVYIANNSPKNFRGRFSAVSHLSSAIGGALGTSFIGGYIDFAGINAVWFLIFLLSLISVALMIILELYSLGGKGTL